MFNELKNASKVDHIAGKCNLPQTEAILHIMLSFNLIPLLFRGDDTVMLLVRRQTCDLHVAGWIPG